MKTPDTEKTSSIKSNLLVLLGLAMLWPLFGCNIGGFLMTPGAFEKKVPPQYDLVSRQDRKILVVIECPRSSGVDFDVKEKLTDGMEKYLTRQMGIKRDNLILNGDAADPSLSADPVKRAKSLGAGYVLMVQVDLYMLQPMNTRNYFTGEMRSRVVLMDTDYGAAVWPQDPRGKIIHVGVDIETQGRDMAVTRLISATTHCALRALYPCEKLLYKNSDELMTLQDAMEMETF